MDCALRRLKFELGVEGVTLEKLFKFYYKVELNQEYGEHEWDTVFVGRYNGDSIIANPDEVQSYYWVQVNNLIRSIIQQLKSKHGIHYSSNEWFKMKTTLLSPLELSVDDCNLLIAPWTVYILLHPITISYAQANFN